MNLGVAYNAENWIAVELAVSQDGPLVNSHNLQTQYPQTGWYRWHVLLHIRTIRRPAPDGGLVWLSSVPSDNTRIVPQIRPCPLPRTSCPVHYTLITSLHTTQHQLHTAVHHTFNSCTQFFLSIQIQNSQSAQQLYVILLVVVAVKMVT
jgi:hypothetical protein